MLDLMDKISDLLCRGEQLEEGGIDDTEALQLLAEKYFAHRNLFQLRNPA